MANRALEVFEKEAFSGTKKTDCRWFPCWQKQDMQSRLSEKKFPEANIEKSAQYEYVIEYGEKVE